MSERAPYSRVYWTIRADDRLDGIYCNNDHLSTWLRLLLAADMAWPAPADIPTSAKARSLAALEAAGVIQIMPGGLFTFHGLDSERGRRRDAAASSAVQRWGSGRIPDAYRTHTGRDASAMLAEPRLDETSNTPLTPLPEGGTTRANGTNPRAVAAALTRQANQAAKERKTRQHQRYIAYSRGKITEAQRIEMDEADTPLSKIPGWAS